MKRFLLFFTISMVLSVADALAQPNIFNPNDPIVPYSSSNPPATPAANKMAKWVRTSRVSWTTTRFKCYYWNGMAFRLRYPNGYDPTNLTKKYPVIIFFHGAGERAPATDNEYQLLWGAQVFETKINAGQFDAFLLFPQILTNDSWNYGYSTKINSVLDSLEKYCKIDPDKVIPMGLSNGGYGALAYATDFPLRSATVIASSPALIQTIGRQENVKHVPLWLSSGGLDPSPDTNVMRGYVDSFRAIGGDLRYTYYPNSGHNTWTDQWNEPYLIPYWNNAHKGNPLIYYQQSQYCADSAANATLGISPGFAQYQWQRNNVDIPGATSNEMVATQLGTYRVRFKRTNASAWSDYSTVPAVLTARPATATPPIQISGIKSRLIPAPDGSTTVPLELPAGYGSYEWRRSSDNVLLSTQRVFQAPVGTYKALLGGCSRTFSPNFTVIDANGTPKPDAAMSLTLTRLSPISVRLNWTDKASPVSDETGFEIYRGATPGGPYTMIYLTAANIKTYTDQNLTENFNGYYRIRSVNNTGAAPLSNEATLQPSSDNVAPGVPPNFRVGYTGHTTIDLDWDNATDNVGVTGYEVYVDNVLMETPTSSFVTVDNLAPNKSYSFKILAVDQAGNKSAYTSSISATTTATGLRYTYYEGNWNSLPDFSTLTPVKRGTTPNVDLTARTAGVNDYFGFVWEGYINIKTAGDYTFETSSDDGSKLYFNTFYSPTATPLVDNDDVHGVVTVTGTVNVAAPGLYPITMTFFEKNSGESMQIYWTGPGITRQLIPNSAFTETYQLPADVVPPSTPGNLKMLYTGRTFTELDWDNSTDNIGVAGYDIYVDSVKVNTSTVSNFSVENLVPNRSHSYKVKAVDLAGNQSAFSTIVATTSAANGLRYRYYEGNWDALPDFNTLTPVKIGSTPNVDISLRTAGVNDYYGFVWEGYINIKTPGNYIFETSSDDGSKLYFNSFYSPTANALVNNDGLHGAGSVTGTVNVATAGLYPITITFFEKNSGESMQVYWQGPGIARQLIPTAAFTETFQLPGDAVAPSVPLNFKVVNASRTTVDIAWDNSTDNVGVTGYDVYVDSVFKTTVTTNYYTVEGLTSNKSHSFKLKGRDLAGNLSAFSTILSAATTANGLRYKYYEGNWDVLPNFSTLTPVKIGSTPNVDISLRTSGVNDFFGFVWEGYINIPTAGTYTFETISDDGSKLYFNTFYSPSATALVNNDGVHGAVPVTAPMNIATPGLYPITITFFEKWSGESMQVYWQGPGIPRQLIPNSAFTETFQQPTDNVAPSVPANVKVIYTSRNFIDLDWDNSTDNVAVTGYDIYVDNALVNTSPVSNYTVTNLIPNKSYSFTVKARDFANNVSALSTAVSGNTVVNGLKYKYYEGNWDLLPDFNALTPVKTGATPNVDISLRTAGVNDFFGFLWEGYLNIPTAGNYTFELVSDDGSKFYFNKAYSQSATVLVDNDGVHGAYPISATTNIAAPGLYPIALTFFEKWSGESMQIYWTGPGIPRQLIPNSAFTETYQIPADVTPPSVPANVKAILTSSSFIDLSWDVSTDNVGVTGYDVYVDGAKKYTTTNPVVRVDTLLNKQYSITIKAKDLAGNTSAFSTAVLATNSPKANGLKYRYYEGVWSALPDFNALTPLKTGYTPNIDLSLRTSGVNDYFGFVWEGYINIPTTGTYTFELVSDDGSKFYFNSFYSAFATPLINHDGLHSAYPVTQTLSITAGLYPIAATFFENTGGEAMEIYWTGPGIPRQLLTNTSLGSASQQVVTSFSGVETSSSMLTANAETGIDANLGIFRAYPNPFREQLNIQFNNTTAGGNTSVGIYDLSGKQLLNQNFGNIAAGKSQLRVNINSNRMLPAVYIVRLNVNGIPVRIWKMMKEKK